MQQLPKGAGFVFENASVSFSPQFPKDENDDRFNTVSVINMRCSYHCMPRIMHIVASAPSSRGKTAAMSPGSDGRPEEPSERAIKEEVLMCFEVPDAQGAKIAVWPASLQQSISSPNTLLDQKPSEEFALGRRPGFPDEVLSNGGDAASELC
jgi:hypothetical protein